MAIMLPIAAIGLIGGATLIHRRRSNAKAKA